MRRTAAVRGTVIDQLAVDLQAVLGLRVTAIVEGLEVSLAQLDEGPSSPRALSARATSRNESRAARAHSWRGPGSPSSSASG